QLTWHWTERICRHSPRLELLTVLQTGVSLPGLRVLMIYPTYGMYDETETRLRSRVSFYSSISSASKISASSSISFKPGLTSSPPVREIPKILVESATLRTFAAVMPVPRMTRHCSEI